MMTPAPSARSTRDACPAAELLRAYALGQLPAGQTELFVLHIVHCPRCAAVLLAMPETTDNVLDSLSLHAADDPERTPLKSAPHQPAPPPRDEPSALRLGRYAIRRVIGRGGFGTVYLAHDTELDRDVAVKVPYAERLGSPEHLAAYHAEARLHASLDHPHVVPIYDVGHSGDAPFYLVSKYVEGENLAERLARQRPAPRQAAALLLPLAEALDDMHRRGLVHRDIKPSNILLDRAGKAYLTDFGLARRVAAGEAGGLLSFAGTPAYMSPEQARGEGDRVDGRCDIYSLGVVLYELLAGRRPFLGERSALLDRILNEDPPAMRAVGADVPAGLEAVCRQAMAKDPAARYQTAAALAADLRRFAAARPRRRAVLAAAGAAVLLLLAAWALWGRDDPAPPPPPEPRPPVRGDGPRVVVTTVPAGAAVTLVPLDGTTGLPRPERRVVGKAGEELAAPPGLYLVVAVLGDGRFHEVYRTVPRPEDELRGSVRHEKWERKDGAVRLERIIIPREDVTRGMCYFAGAPSFTVGSAELKLGGLALVPPHRRRVPAFYLDATEVTRGDYRRRAEGARFAAGDRDGEPMTELSWDQAVAHAEREGKRLPDEAEYEYAATAGGTRRFPWGDDDAPLRGKPWAFGPAGQPAHDRLEMPGQREAACGLYSNVAEWTSSWPASYPGQPAMGRSAALRVVRGGPHAVIHRKGEIAEPIWGPRWRFAASAAESFPGLGFRGARSARPRTEAADFAAVLGP